NKNCKRNYRTSDKTKVLRKIFDAKINLLHTIEEAKLIFESLKKQYNFDKLYEILDNLQDTSDKKVNARTHHNKKNTHHTILQAHL
ncbi:19827_t:CDS:1, partial [Racocetra persica]